jgi:hypothetical protein
VLFSKDAIRFMHRILLADLVKSKIRRRKPPVPGDFPRTPVTTKPLMIESALAIFPPEAAMLSASRDALEARGVAFIGLNGADEVFLLEPIDVP